MLKIAIFTAEDYAFLFNAWCDFVDLAKGRQQVSGIFVFPDVIKGKRGFSKYWEYLKIFGPADLMRLSVKTICYERTRKNKKYSDFSDLAQKNSIPIFYKNNPNDAEVINLVKETGADVILISFGYILKKPLIEAPKICVLNKHSALLPAFRGLWPVFWAMKAGRDIGATIHKVGAGVDNGEIILQKKYSAAPHSVFDWYDIIYKDMAAMFLEALDNIASGERKTVFPDSAPSYYSLPARAEYKEFKSKGLKFI